MGVTRRGYLRATRPGETLLIQPFAGYRFGLNTTKGENHLIRFTAADRNAEAVDSLKLELKLAKLVRGGLRQLQLSFPQANCYSLSDMIGPRAVQYLPNQAKFSTVILDRLLTDPDVIRPGEDYTFFFQPNIADSVLPFLRKTFPEDVITPEIYTDNLGKIIFVSWSYNQKRR